MLTSPGERETCVSVHEVGVSARWRGRGPGYVPRPRVLGTLVSVCGRRESCGCASCASPVRSPPPSEGCPGPGTPGSYTVSVPLGKQPGFSSCSLTSRKGSPLQGPDPSSSAGMKGEPPRSQRGCPATCACSCGELRALADPQPSSPLHASGLSAAQTSLSGQSTQPAISAIHPSP